MSSSAEQELRDLIAERVAAIHAKNPKPLADRHAADVVAFNVLPPLQLRGSDEINAQTRTWFASYPGDIGYEVEQLTVHADGDVGFCSFLYHVTGTLADGNNVDMWVRATLGCRRADGEWKIVHDHESVPFNPETGTALTGPVNQSFDAANIDVARALLQAYVDQDRDTAEALLADELTFTSPQDDHIDRQAYFERCFPTADRLRSQTLLHAAALNDHDVVITYEYELQTGERHRNTEIITVRRGKASEIQVFFGGKVA